MPAWLNNVLMGEADRYKSYRAGCSRPCRCSRSVLNDIGIFPSFTEELQLKIAICSKMDLAGCLALNRLLEGFAGRHEVFVMLSDYVLAAEKAEGLAATLVLHERDWILEHIFPYLDARFPEGSQARYLTYAGLAARYGVPMELRGAIRTPASVQRMRELAPDLIISCRYDYIIPEAVFSIPALGTYGLHPGALPALQGLCSPYRAMERGDAQSGCTMFQLDAGLDTGPIVEIGWHDIAYDRSVLWNFVHTYFAGIEVLMHHLPELEAGRALKATPQTGEGRQYYSYPTEEELQAFMRKGGHLVLPGDYLEFLSQFLPDGMHDAHMPALEQLVSSLES